MRTLPARRPRLGAGRRSESEDTKPIGLASRPLKGLHAREGLAASSSHSLRSIALRDTTRFDRHASGVPRAKRVVVPRTGAS